MDIKRKLYKDTLPYGIGLTALVAGSGFFLSSRNLHGYGMSGLNETSTAAWALPMAFDLAPFALTLIVFSAALAGRSAPVWRAGILAFAGLSAWINWLHAPSSNHHVAQIIAVLLPLSAVAALEGIFHEIKVRAQKKETLPRVPFISWFVSPARAYKATKTRALRPLLALETILYTAETPSHAPILTSTETETVSQSLIVSPSRRPRKSPGRGLTPETLAHLREMWEAGKTVSDVVADGSIDVGRATVYRRFNEWEAASTN